MHIASAAVGNGRGENVGRQVRKSVACPYSRSPACCSRSLAKILSAVARLVPTRFRPLVACAGRQRCRVPAAAISHGPVPACLGANRRFSWAILLPPRRNGPGRLPFSCHGALPRGRSTTARHLSSGRDRASRRGDAGNAVEVLLFATGPAVRCLLANGG